MELLGSVNKVDSKVISRISGVRMKRLDGSEYFRQKRHKFDTYAILSNWRFDPGPRNLNHFQRQSPLNLDFLKVLRTFARTSRLGRTLCALGFFFFLTEHDL